jgi:hypothetical protein|tara:strand:- start:260 stop:592 length:333 start_codon:yes stop_codon:yes gene_type:complete
LKIKVVVIFRKELALSNDDCIQNTHFININLGKYKLIDFQKINLIELNIKIQDSFYFVDSVISELAYQNIDLPSYNKWIRGCLVIKSIHEELDINSVQFFEIYSDFHTTL